MATKREILAAVDAFGMAMQDVGMAAMVFGGKRSEQARLDDAIDLRGEILRLLDEPLSECAYCGGAGDVHRADGEWLGVCPDCVTT